MQKTPLIALFLFAACSDDPVNYSEPVGIELKVKSGEVSALNALSPEKSITTESGNPYGAFVTEAENRLGHDPSNIVLDKVTVTLGAQSTNVAALEQVMTGEVFVKFLINDTNNTYNAGRWTSPTGQGPVEGEASFDMAMVADGDVEKVLGGGFKVVLNAPAATDFATKGAEAVLQLTFTFTAFE
ncbi:MAG TPA: hypothetical protein VIV11_34310 [Kofleriaceae bacterium]